MPAEHRAPKRIGTAVQTIFNNKWTYPAVPPNAIYAFNSMLSKKISLLSLVYVRAS
jgi:hypothetical protein